MRGHGTHQCRFQDGIKIREETTLNNTLATRNWILMKGEWMVLV